MKAYSDRKQAVDDSEKKKNAALTIIGRQYH